VDAAEAARALDDDRVGRGGNGHGMAQSVLMWTGRWWITSSTGSAVLT
jgi:hypothetical protein